MVLMQRGQGILQWGLQVQADFHGWRRGRSSKEWLYHRVQLFIGCNFIITTIVVIIFIICIFCPWWQKGRRKSSLCVLRERERELCVGIYIYFRFHLSPCYILLMALLPSSRSMLPTINCWQGKGATIFFFLFSLFNLKGVFFGRFFLIFTPYEWSLRRKIHRYISIIKIYQEKIIVYTMHASIIDMCTHFFYWFVWFYLCYGLKRAPSVAFMLLGWWWTVAGSYYQLLFYGLKG